MEESIAAAAARRELGTDRLYWLDAARAMSVLLVALNHAMTRSVLSNYSLLRQGGLFSFSVALLCVFTHVSVPMFLMISGHLLLGRDYSSPQVRGRFYRHNWGRILLAAVIWLAIRFWFFLALDGSLTTQSFTVSLRQFARHMLLLNNNLGPLWYMVMIVCVYPLIPMIGTAVTRLPGKVFLLPAAIVVAVSFLIPNLNAALHAAGRSLQLESAVDAGYLVPIYLVYLVGGWYVGRGVLDRLPTALIAAVFVVSLLGTGLFQYWMYTDGAYTVRNADIGTLVSSFSMFELLRRKARPRRVLGPAVRGLGVYGLGVYYVHHLLMCAAHAWLHKHYPDFAGYDCCALLTLVGVGGGFLLVWLTAKIPPVGKYLYVVRSPKKNS